MYKDFINKFTGQEKIFKEDLVLSLTEDLRLTLEDTDEVISYILSGVISEKKSYLEDIILKRNMVVDTKTLNSIVHLIRSFEFRILVSKRNSNILDETTEMFIIKTLENTNGKMVFIEQGNMIFNFLNRMFYMEVPSDEELHSTELIKNYIEGNFIDMRTEFPKTYNKLIDSIVSFPLKNESIFERFPTHKDSIIHSLYSNIYSQ